MFIKDQCSNKVCSFEFLNWFIDEFQEDYLYLVGGFDGSEDDLFKAADDAMYLCMAI